MSQVAISRPVSHQSHRSGGGGVPNLPQIQHPLSRLSNPENLDVRGVSRSGDRPFSSLSEAAGRPLAHEGVPYRSRSLHSSQGRESRKSATFAPQQYDAIPEGVEVTQGDPNKTRLPVFGSRAGLASRDGLESRVSSRLSNASSQARLEIDELEMLLREKAKTGFYELRKRFKDNDPQQEGNVTREALARIIVTMLNRQISQSQYNRLMDRIGLKDKQMISFVEFFTAFREVPSADFPQWMDPIQRHYQEKAAMTAAQVHMHFKEKAKQRVNDIVDLIPQCNPDGAGRILKPEFRNALNQMMFHMDDEEFEKLWNKYDTEGYGTISGEKMMQKLGVSTKPSSAPASAGRVSAAEEKQAEDTEVCKTRSPRKKEVERQRSLNVERWLKKKFREGFQDMKEAFVGHDKEKSGMVGFDEFLSVLTTYGLKLEKIHLAEFLARCGVEPNPTGVPYREFLHRFLDRSDRGMAHNILTNPKHRYNQERVSSPGGVSAALSSIESQLMNMFQRDFLSLLGTFHKIDRYGTDVISQEEFRAAIESRFGLELTEQQFSNFIDRLPLNEDGLVRYADFMSQFDTKGQAPSLFTVKDPLIEPLPRTPTPPTSPHPKSPVNEELLPSDKVKLDDEDEQARRSTQELFKIIKDLMRRKFQALEEAFHEIDEQNSGRITQETMYQMLKKFDVKPEITRGEIRDLWSTFITNQNRTLSYHEFLRHFGYSLKSASFPNAKRCPPKKGDSDFMMRSRKLNSDPDMLLDNLRSKIDFMWDELRKEFVAMDPYGTGFVNSDEFRDVLTELVVQLTDYEQEALVKKFDLKKDGRVSYVEFLKPFAMKRQIWREGNNMLQLLQHPQPELPMPDIVEPPQKGLQGISAKLRQKLSGDWKNLRRAFKKLDTNNVGYLSLPEFRSVLKLANVILDEEEVYQIMNQFDEDMSGKIHYNKFINDTFKPGSRNSVRKSNLA